MRDRLFNPAFVLVSVANLLQVMAFFLFVHLPGYLSDLGADEIQIGIVIGIAAFASILLRPLVGREMDRRGRRPVILAGNVVNVVAVSLYLLVDSLGPFLYVVRALHGIGEATLFTALSTYAADVIPVSRRNQGLALFGVSGMIPLALGSLTGDLLLRLGDYDLLFTVAAGFAAAALIASLPLSEPLVEGGGVRTSHPLHITLRRAALLPLWWLTVVFAIAIAGYFTFIKTYIAEIGAGSVGAFFASYAGMAVLLRLVAGWLPDRYGPNRVLFPALGLLAAGFVVLALSPTAGGVVTAGLLCGAGHAYVFPILFTQVVTRADAAERGTAMAIYTGLYDVGTLAGGPALGAIIATAGYPVMFGAAAVLVVVGTIVFGRWDRGRGIPGPRRPERVRPPR
ncbi:MAG: MFS transporter [Actinobacteria bacterium]|nr:MFS transporter [Actinomycetota bacterium]MBU1492657.1 MFS transporter [Actinomycetota bacterium]MBU1864815.1 MFS transporter [Actinomycetota bacterium]